MCKVTMIGVIALLALAERSCFAQAIVHDAVGRGEDLLFDYVVGRQDVGKQYAVIGMGELVKTDTSKNRVVRIHRKYLDVRDDESEMTRFTAFRFQKEEGEKLSVPIWEQVLRKNGKTHLRRGSSGRREGSMVRIEDDDLPEEDRKLRRMVPAFDPYFLVFSDLNTYITSRSNYGYAQGILLQTAVNSASRKDGLLITNFRFPDDDRWSLTVAFDDRQGGRPVEVVWRHRPYGKRLKAALAKGKISEEDYIVTTRATARWEKQLIGRDGQTSEVWLPILVQRVDCVGANQEQMNELDVVFTWEALESKHFPNPDSDDWKQGFTDHFQIDWDISYQEFAHRNGIKLR